MDIISDCMLLLNVSYVSYEIDKLVFKISYYLYDEWFIQYLYHVKWMDFTGTLWVKDYFGELNTVTQFSPYARQIIASKIS